LLRVENISEENLEDVFKICSWNRAFAPTDDPVLEKAREFKRRWLLDMLEQYGPCTKIAYLDGKPVAQILFYPEETVPYLHHPRKDVINLKCILNPFPEAQRKGVGAALMKALVDEGYTGLDCLGGRPCRFVVTRPFPHEGDLPLADFYEKYGFKQGHQEMFLEIKEKYVPMDIPKLSPLPEDRGRTILLYNVNCEWGYYYATTARDLIQSKHPDHPVEVFNSWKEPEEYKKRGDGWMLIAVGILVNGKVPENPFIFWVDRKAFLRNVEEAMRQ
jgi:GNAT superfamily N-acetyltransferase